MRIFFTSVIFPPKMFSPGILYRASLTTLRNPWIWNKKNNSQNFLVDPQRMREVSSPIFSHFPMGFEPVFFIKGVKELRFKQRKKLASDVFFLLRPYILHFQGCLLDHYLVKKQLLKPTRTLRKWNLLTHQVCGIKWTGAWNHGVEVLLISVCMSLSVVADDL